MVHDGVIGCIFLYLYAYMYSIIYLYICACVCACIFVGSVYVGYCRASCT